MKKLQHISLLVLLFFCQCSHAQNKLDSLNTSLNHFKRTKDFTALADVSYQISKIHYNNYNDSLSIIAIEKAIAYAQKTKDYRQLCVFNNQFGNILSSQGNLKSALKKYRRGFSYADSLKNDTLKSILLNNIGLELKSLGNYKEASIALFDALKLKEKIGASNASISSTLLNLGLVLDIIGKPQDALNYYKKSLLLKRELDDSLGIARVLSNIAVIEKNSSNYSVAIETILESNEFNNTIQDVNLLYINHTNLGNIYKYLNDPNLAGQHLSLALRYAEKLDNTVYLSDIHQNLGDLYDKQKKYKLSNFHFEKALKLAKHSGSIVLLHEIHTQLADNYAELKDFDQAYFHLSMSNSYSDTIRKNADQKVIAEVQAKYETEKKEKLIALQQLKLVKSEAENRKRTIILISVTGGFLFILMIGTILFQRYRQQQKEKHKAVLEKIQGYRMEIELLHQRIDKQLGDSASSVNIALPDWDINSYLIDPLSEREKEILAQISDGKTNKEIADALFISTNTVKFHLKNLYIKLDVRNRVEAIAKLGTLPKS